MSTKKETYEYYLRLYRIEAAGYKHQEAQLRSAPPQQQEYLQESLRIRRSILCSLGEMLDALKQDLESDLSETQ